jgi:hypothetical protein
MKQAAAGIGSAGGHPKAAGGIVYDWNVFKARLLKELRR